MRKFSALLLCLSTLAVAEEPPVLEWPHWQSRGDQLQLVGRQAPTSCYFRFQPDRLVVEYAGVQSRGAAPGAPRMPGVSSVRWRQPDLSHVICEVQLSHRLPPEALKLQGTTLTVDMAYDWQDRFRLAPGVSWLRRERASEGRYLLWNELLADPSVPGVALDVGLANERTDAREKTTSMIQRLGALAGINGGYFNNSGGPLGVVYKGGKLLAPHVERRPPRTVLGVMKDRSIEFDQVVARKGQLASRSGKTWDQVELALGGGPRLLRRGEVALTTNEEELGPNGNDITRVAGRSAVAVLKDGKVLLVTASGYHDTHREGLRLEELAGELLRRGGQEAMNLDGGASTTMAVGDVVVSRGPVAPKAEKPVATTLLVRHTQPSALPYRMQLSGDSKGLLANGSSQLQLTVTLSDSSGRPVPDGTNVRLFSERLRLPQSQVSLKGGQARFQALALKSLGDALVRAECAGVRQDFEVQLFAGPANRLWAQLLPVQGMPGKFLATVQAVDASGNGVAHCSLSCLDAGQTTTSLTGSNGQTHFEVFRAVGSPASTITLQAEGGLQVALQVPAVEAAPAPTPSSTVSPSPTPAAPGEGE
jgi:hypothetical protein